ncbi:hypothetical protein D1B33_05430 [Lysinibacillus yapensis]|uniref:Uncharacterized protein n=1 Tax=Ureibacillus yapensis TaxID=2304605 RepID=A0A396SAH0_9BACL|nr:hypothetical protein D1B33_05430 [Lysinibacillus yapensis]
MNSNDTRTLHLEDLKESQHHAFQINKHLLQQEKLIMKQERLLKRTKNIEEEVTFRQEIR